MLIVFEVVRMTLTTTDVMNDSRRNVYQQVYELKYSSLYIVENRIYVNICEVIFIIEEKSNRCQENFLVVKFDR